MPPECYNVEVLHLLNPHLIWVEVRDTAIISISEDDINFEQIGIYGLLPLETTIDVDDEEVTIQRCKEWLPAAATLMREFLDSGEEIWFTPIHLDRRSSIFDDNIHKFGDLLVKKKSGKTRSLSKLLRTSGFATYDACLFHQYLSIGKINTKLNNVETHKVLTELEKYFISKNVPKKKWEKPIKKQTSVFRVTCELEEALTKTNLDKHNKNMKAILESKNKDLELCKGVDELSLGRATTRKGKDKKKSTPVEMKLALLNSPKTNASLKDIYENKDNEYSQVFEDTKIFLEANSSCSKKISAKTDAHKAQILKKVMSKTAIKKIAKQEKLVSKNLIESKEKIRATEINRKIVNQNHESLSNSSQASMSGPEHNDIPKKSPDIPKEAENTAPSTSKPDQNILEKCNHNIEHKFKNLDTKRKGKTSSKSNRELSVKAQNTVAPVLKEEHKGHIDSNSEEHHQHTSKGKGTKRIPKAEFNALILETQEPLDNFKQGFHTRSKSPLQRLAYPPQNKKQDQQSDVSRRVPELPNDCKAFTSKPVSEYMVNKLMNTFKLTGSKHSDMIQNAIRKCKDGAKNNSEAIAALLECRSKIIDEIKELDDPMNHSNINLDMPLPQTVSKCKLKRRGRKHNATNGRPKVLYGPPGTDVNTLTRVPPVLLYGKEMSSNDSQNVEVVPKHLDSLGDEDITVRKDLDKNAGLSCGYETKILTENMKMQESEIKKQRNGNKDTSSSCSSVWERRLKLHKEISKTKRCASQTSDTTNKDSSNVEGNIISKNISKQHTDEDSDESIPELIKTLATKYSNNSSQAIDKYDQELIFTSEQAVVNANPFKNLDLNNSVFVDNLVTPVLMVHSKMNKRFVPTCNLRDINFSDHIRFMLKNLRIERPMVMQSITWNAILRGYSVFMIGSAFSGKTMGYLPAVCRLVTDFNQSDSYCESVGPFCIIVCATSQSVSEIEKIARMLVGCDEKVISCYYGHDELAIATSLLNGCELLICTAPSLVRLLQMSEFGVDLQRLTTFVFDDFERTSEVYTDELKFCLFKIKEMLKSRINKELLVQYVIASRTWCDFMKYFANKAPDTVVCIGGFQECVLYAKANMTVSYVKKENKLNHLIEFLNDIDPSKRTVIVCDSDEEVDFLKRAIQTNKYFIFASTSNMTVQDLYNLSLLWKEFKEPLMAPILICCDANLYYMNIVNANYLVHYSIPSMYSIFCRRFATLNEVYPSIFRKDNQQIKILILLQENNVEQFPKIINFVKRCTNNIPDFLDVVCADVLAKKDAKKAESFVPLCNNLMSLGDCPDLYNCKSRHTILKEYDKPKEWMPKSGLVTFKILHYHNAAFYSARLIANFDVRMHSKYPQSYSSISLKMGIHYSNQKNRISLGIPKLGDVCAVALGNNLVSRGQVIKIIDRPDRGNSKDVLVNLLDEEIIESTTDTNLYYLPDELKSVDTYVVHIRVANIQSKDKDIVFSELAKDHVKKVSNDLKKNMYMKGKIVLTIGNCIFVDTLETCQDLKSLNETVVLHNVKRELLEKHAEVNPDHIPKIEELCKRAEIETKVNENKIEESLRTVNLTSNVTWAHLDDTMAMVDFGAIENPDTLFIRLTKFENCMKALILDIQKYVADNTAKIEELIKDDIVLAEYPDDGMYERARIDEIDDERIKCFFVDQGEWRHLTKDKFIPISEKLITQLPFQAIECRLVGIKPLGDQWTDFSSNWLFDKCADTESGATKLLYVKYFTKELARFTGGYKYGVVIVDTYGNEDVIVNRAMIELNLAQEVEAELEFLDVVKLKDENLVKCHDEDDDDDSWEKLSKYSTNSDSVNKLEPNILLSQPIRSVPLIGSDEESDDSDKWNINMTDDLAEMFKPLAENLIRESQPKLPAIESNAEEILEKIDIDSLSKNIEECSRQFQRVKINLDSSKELDSDDLSLPESSFATVATSEKVTELDLQLRKPKINWRQTKTTVLIKIQLIGVENYDLNIQDRALTFTATANDTSYGFDIELYGVIDKNNAVHSNKGQYILVKFNKIMHKNWLTLTKDGSIRKWIVYDVDSIDTSSDEEEVHNDNLYNIMKNMHNVDSDSDDDIVDDVSYRHKYDS